MPGRKQRKKIKHRERMRLSRRDASTTDVEMHQEFVDCNKVSEINLSSYWQPSVVLERLDERLINIPKHRGTDTAETIEKVFIDCTVWFYGTRQQCKLLKTVQPCVSLEKLGKSDTSQPIDDELKTNKMYHFRKPKSQRSRRLYLSQWYASKKESRKLAEKCRYAKNRAAIIAAVKRKYHRFPRHRAEKIRHSIQIYRNVPLHRAAVIKRAVMAYHDDPVHRAKVIERATSAYHDDPVHRAQMITRSVARATKAYHDDPVHQAQVITRSVARATEAYHSDPVHRAQVITRSVTRATTAYHDDPVHRAQVITRATRAYHEDAEHREATIRRAKRRYDEDDEYRQQMNRPKRQRHHATSDSLAGKFQTDISFGPEYVCCCCHKLLFKDQVRVCNVDDYNNSASSAEMAERCIVTTYLHECSDGCSEDCDLSSSRGSLWVCFTCHRKLVKGDLPSEASVNNLQLSPIPEVLSNTNVLERQLLSLRLPFIKMVALPKGGQHGVFGTVVSVPSNVQQTVVSLPRSDNTDALLKVKLKKNLEYTGYVRYLFINPSHLADALEYLKAHNQYYQDIPVDMDDFENPVPEASIQVESDDDSSTNDEGENEADGLRGLQLDTCMQPIDIGQEFLDQNFDNIYCVAPAARNSPVSILREKGNEVMSFPVQFPDGKGCYDGEREQRLTLHRYFLSRVLNVDNRFSSDMSYIFYAQYLNDLQHIISSVSIALRKGTEHNRSGGHFTAGDITSREELRGVLNSDSGYRFLSPVRGTPPFWQKVLRDLFAMITQLGKPTWFMSFSSADMRWEHIINAILRQMGSEKRFTNLNYNEKCEVLKSNPVTAARMFDRQFRLFLRDVILSNENPIGKVSDYFFRIEFQQRGSPHAHSLFWIDGAPELDKDADEDVIDFIDRHVSCELPNEDDAVLFEQVTSVQTHSKNHSKSCKKGRRKGACRFNFPREPSSRTFISRPKRTLDSFPWLNQEETVATATTMLKRVRECIESSNDFSRDFDTVLQEVGITQDEFEEFTNILADRVRIINKRSVDSVWVNNYNPELLRCWNANLDIQYITDVNACVMYIISYITKAEQEMGLVLEKADKEAKQGNLSAQESMKKIGGAYLHHREVGAQEAIYRLCELPLKECSRKVQFIPVGQNPVRFTRPLSVLRSEPGDSEEIWVPNIIEKYKNRPLNDVFNEMCLASFCSEYRLLSSSQVNLNSPHVHQLLNDQGYIMKRTRSKPAVIRYPKYSEENNAEEFYFSNMQLFLPHRTDEDLKPHPFHRYEDYFKLGVYEETDSYVKDVVEETRSCFEAAGYSSEELEELANTVEFPESAWAALFPEQEAERLECQQLRPISDNTEPLEENIPDLFGTSRKERDNRNFSIESQQLTREEVLPLLRSMNEKQKEIFYTVRDFCLQTTRGRHPSPFHMFLTGSAGTGKSHLVHCIAYECRRILAPTLPHPEAVSVLLTSTTGAAAFNIGGTTLHHAFSLPLNMRAKYENLREERVSALRKVLGHLKILIIDEISLVGEKVLNWVHLRLRQIKQTGDAPFGNVSVIAVGDFYQLAPITGTPLYKSKGNFDLWNDHFKICNLTEIMRQRDSCEFANLLNSLRTRLRGEPLSSDHVRALQHCRETVVPDDTLHIFPKNKHVNAHNAEMLRKKCPVVVEMPALDFRKDASTGRLRPCPRPLPLKKGLNSNLKLGVGAKVMLTRNIDISDGLVNGALGTVMDIVSTNNSIYQIVVKFDNPRVGKNAVQQQVEKRGVVIPRHQEHSTEMDCVRHQFPLDVSWACSNHKVQGMSCDKAVVSLGSTWAAGMAYVGLSRVRDISGLKIIDLNLDKIYSSRDVSDYLEKMPRFQLLKMPCPVAHDLVLSVCLHNTEGLIPHIEDVKCNQLLLSSDVICFTETWLSHNSGPQIDNFAAVCQCRAASFDTSCELFSNFKSQARGGVAIYTKVPEMVQVHFDTRNIEYVAVLDTRYKCLFVVIYRPPSYPSSVFCEQLNELLFEIDLEEDMAHSYVVGDFNEDSSESRGPIQTIFFRHGYEQCVRDPTTESGRTIDHVYIRDPKDRPHDVIVTPTYYSYHEAVFFQAPLDPPEIEVEFPDAQLEPSSVQIPSICDTAVVSPLQDGTIIDEADMVWEW